MVVNVAEVDSDLFKAVRRLLRERDGRATPQGWESFVQHFYQWVAADDLADRDERDLAGAAVSAWELAATRKPGVAKVRVFNPSQERDGWE